MSVIGIDFGNDSSYIAVARAGGIETIANDYSLRSTPSYVAFGDHDRTMGVAAKNKVTANIKNTIFGFKTLLGRQYNDPLAKEEMRSLPYRFCHGSEGGIGIKVNYLGDERPFSPEQVAGMMFTKLKDISESALQTKVSDCVISVPVFFTDAERHALLNSAAIAGLNVLRLMNDPCAVALAYGIYKQDLPALEEKPRNVIFVDCGHTSLQVSACAFNKGKLKMLACSWDNRLGGRDFDVTMAKHFCEEFKTKYKMNVAENPRAFLRLVAEVEKLKKQMSANSTNLPLNIECFMDDKDVHSGMKRADMEAMCAGLFQRVENTLQLCLEQSKLNPSDIHSVELVGGSTRIPAIKQLIEKTFNLVPSTTLNQDEAVSRGCALQCAMLSPAFKVREFSITDLQPYPIALSWNASLADSGEMEVFPLFHAVPFSKMLTFFQKEPFTVKAYYTGSVPYSNPIIGEFTIRDVKPNAENEAQKVKVKVRVNLNGIFTVSSATMVEKREIEQAVDELMETETQASAQQNHDGSAKNAGEQENKMETESLSENNEGNKVEKEEQEKKKKKSDTKTVNLPVDAKHHGLNEKALNAAIELEGQLIAQDRLEKERMDAKNALEEYVYDMRSRIQEEDNLKPFISESDRALFAGKLDSTENWLYEDGENCKKQIYIERLTDLKSMGEPVKTRHYEYSHRQHALEELGSALQLARKVVEMYKNGDERFSHLETEEIQKVEAAISEKSSWRDKQLSSLQRVPLYENPPVRVKQIQSEKQNFDSTVNPIINKQKPRVEPPPAEKPAEASETQEKTDSQGGPNGNDSAQQQTTQEHMDVD